MKTILTCLLFLVCASGYAEEIERQPNFIEKQLNLADIVSNGRLAESIGIETLADIVTPLMTSGSFVPVSTSIKLGISADCQCAKLKLFRIPTNSEKRPVEITYDAIQGFTERRIIEVALEVTEDAQLHLKVESPAGLKPGESLRWVSARELKLTEVSQVKTEKQVEPILNKIEPNAK